MFIGNKITEFFFMVDEFCKFFDTCPYSIDFERQVYNHFKAAHVCISAIPQWNTPVRLIFFQNTFLQNPFD